MSPSIIIASSRSSITVRPGRSSPSAMHGYGVPASHLVPARSPVYLLPPGGAYPFQEPRVYWPCPHQYPFASRSFQLQGQQYPPPSPTPAPVVSNTCPQCWRYRRHPQHQFCSITCSQYAALFAPQVKYLPPHHEVYIGVVNQFITRWTSSPCPNVLGVYQITWKDTVRRSFEQYRDAVEAQGRFSSTGSSPGNEQKRFRGTNRACTLGERGNVIPCHNEACLTCEAIRHGFEPHLRRKQNIPWNGAGIRLGAGIYTGYASSKADEYASNSHDPGSNVRAMLVCRVVIGKPYEVYQDDPTIRRPPAGYDCVLGKSVPGGAFTDDEYVVYDADAIRPAYLILYEGTAAAGRMIE